DSVTSVERFPIGWSTLSCGGLSESEPVFLDGDYQVVSHVTLDGNGGAHTETHLEVHVVGTGQVTGYKYQYNENQKGGLDVHDLSGLPAEQTFNLSFTLTSQHGGTTNVKTTIHEVIDQNGETKLFSYHQFGKCPQGDTFVCGDGYCQGLENCNNCAADCGA